MCYYEANPHWAKLVEQKSADPSAPLVRPFSVGWFTFPPSASNSPHPRCTKNMAFFRFQVRTLRSSFVEKNMHGFVFIYKMATNFPLEQIVKTEQKWTLLPPRGPSPKGCPKGPSATSPTGPSQMGPVELHRCLKDGTLNDTVRVENGRGNQGRRDARQRLELEVCVR